MGGYVQDIKVIVVPVQSSVTVQLYSQCSRTSLQAGEEEEESYVQTVQERSPSSRTGESFVQYRTVVHRGQWYLVPAWDMKVIVYP